MLLFRLFRRFPLVLSTLAAAILPEFGIAAPANITTWRNDNARSGVNANEGVLAPGNVNPTDFGKLFQIAVDGLVMAQPLYLSGVSIPRKGIHNVLYVATEHDSVYACDADDGTVLWHAVLLKAGETPSNDGPGMCDNSLFSEVGITATPVISGSTIYVHAMSNDSSGAPIHRLHALDVTTGAELVNSPTDIAATYPGTGFEGGNGTVVFNPRLHLIRAALTLSNGAVYLATSSFCDSGPYNSWILGYDSSSLKQVSVLNVTPNGKFGSIWQAGAGLAVDQDGNLFAITGNGTLDQQLDASGFPALKNFGNSFIKISVANNQPQVTDYFSPYNTVDETNNDLDLGSGGVLLLPPLTDQTGQVRKLAVGGGKDHHLYILDRDNMGKFRLNSTDNNNIYQDVPPETFAALIFTTPLYFNGRLYVAAVRDTIKAFGFTNARLNTTPLSHSATTFGFPGTTPSLSADGTAHGILWGTQRAEPAATLHAYDANDLSHELFNSDQAANGRDQFGPASKFVPPTIANGKVYQGAGDAVTVFGLFNPPRLANISTRAEVGTGENALIAGFIIQGSAPRKLVIRGIGPSLRANGTPVAGAMANPLIELHDRNGAVIAQNDDWGSSAEKDQIMATGVAPEDPRESAILRTLDPGTYTAVLRGSGNTTGIGLVDFYDITATYNSTLANISSRGSVGVDDNVLIGGFIVQGVAKQRMIVRAIGPDLIGAGVDGALADPILELHTADGTQLALNDNWRDATPDEVQASDLAPQDDKDAAFAITLAAGNYTAIVRGAGNSTGIALVEAYAVK